MVWRRDRRSAVLGAAVLVGCFAAGAPGLRAASTTWLITFSIDNDDPAYAVAGDGLGAATAGAAGLYKDYRLSTGQPDDINYCVEASPASPGNLFIRFNRKLDGDAGSLYCGLNGGQYPRQYSLTINNDSACAELWANGYGTGPAAPCVFDGLDKPRIRINNDLWARQTTKTPVAFLSGRYADVPVSYEVRSQADAEVIRIAADPSMRVVRATSQPFRLFKFQSGVRAHYVAESFVLPFQMTFTRTAQ